MTRPSCGELEAEVFGDAYLLDGGGPVVAQVATYLGSEPDAHGPARTNGLLAQILPGAVIVRMKRGEAQIADRHEQATVLCADIVGFTAFADSVAPERIVSLLSRAFLELDRLTTVPLLVSWTHRWR